MIYVEGVPFLSDDSSQVRDTLTALMEHPALVSASRSFKAIPEKKISASEDASERLENHKFVYLFQREYATVDPVIVDLVGTDEATTCVGFVLRNPKTGMTSVGHLDSPNVVDIGLKQMLSLVEDHNSDTLLDVHVVGAFDDISSKHAKRVTNAYAKLDGYSYPLCTKIVENLRKSGKKFNIQTLQILGHNTRLDSEGNAFPIFHGVVVETSTGSIAPACFDRTSRCPDEVVRRIRVTSSFEDPNWTGRLLETYDTRTDRFVIAPCTWTIRKLHIASALRDLSDEEILLKYSTSPYAEGPDFVDGARRKWDYLIQHPDWRKTFPLKQPRVFKRKADGTWVKL